MPNGHCRVFAELEDDTGCACVPREFCSNLSDEGADDVPMSKEVAIDEGADDVPTSEEVAVDELGACACAVKTCST